MGFIKLILIISLTFSSGWVWGDTGATAAVPAPVTSPSAAAPTHAELALFAMGLIGSVYKPGGDNPGTGMDCSGFVKYVYSEVAGLKLPHSALAISKISTVIHKAQLEPGDLVFFKTMKNAFSHVGIYLGNNQFIHAASTKTGIVMISHLDDAYWSSKYDGARRLLHADTASSSVTDANATSSDLLPAASENAAVTAVHGSPNSMSISDH